MEPLHDVASAATYLGRTETWVTEAARRGDIPSRKVGRFRRFTESDLNAYLDSVRDGGVTGRARRKRAS